MKNKSLQYYVDKLKEGPYSLVRFGDGELYCLWGRGTKNSNGCYYTPELRADLAKSLKYPKDGIIYGLQRVLPEDQKQAEHYSVDWHDSEIFGDELVAGRLFPLFEQLKKMRVVMISNPDLLDPVAIQPEYFIQVPTSNAHTEKDWVYREVRACQRQWPAGTVYIFCCGMAANAFVYELHDGKNWYLDLGHIFDPFVGKMSRCNLEGIDPAIIQKNLCAQ